MLKKLPLEKIYQYIEPGPVVLLATQAPKAKPNVMAMSWHMMMEFEPPLIGVLVSGNNYSFAALTKTRECVITIPPMEMLDTLVSIGNCSGRDVDKFARFPLTPLPAEHVAPPLIGECIASLECRVTDTRMMNKYNMFVLTCVQGWENPKLRGAKMLHHKGWGTFVPDGEPIKTKSKMR